MDRPRPPESCAIAFKEWAGICDALASGRQSIILRKGGIEEGPRGFAPEHPAFWLYPTSVHQAEQGLKAPHLIRSPSAPGTVAIRTLAVVEHVFRADDLETLLQLDSLHAWTEETVRKRFDYRSPGLWVLAVRAYNRADPASVEVTPSQLGCKTWVPLEPPIAAGVLAPARTEAEAEGDLERLRAAIGAGAEGLPS